MQRIAVLFRIFLLKHAQDQSSSDRRATTTDATGAGKRMEHDQ